MKALILNSGVGHRMGDLTANHPKAMTEIGGGYTILSHQLTQLTSAGVRDVVITTGPFAELLQAHVASLGLDINVRYVPNPDYATTNYIVSMCLASPLLHDDDAILMHGDLVLENSVLRDLLASPVSAMAVDTALPLPEKDFKARLQDGRITGVGVDLFGRDCVACQPAYKWRKNELCTWLDAISSFVRSGQTTVYAENAFNAHSSAIPLYPLELNGRLCNEIDNPDDLRAVSARFLQLSATEVNA